MEENVFFDGIRSPIFYFLSAQNYLCIEKKFLKSFKNQFYRGLFSKINIPDYCLVQENMKRCCTFILTGVDNRVTMEPVLAQ